MPASCWAGSQSEVIDCGPNWINELSAARCPDAGPHYISSAMGWSAGMVCSKLMSG
jgi:hypothetical protein